jgi:hypothetical protein
VLAVAWLEEQCVADPCSHHQTLSKQALQRAGLIDYRHKRVVIHDRIGLESTACECYPAVRRLFGHQKP